MKRFAGILILALALDSLHLFGASREAQWKEVDDAVAKGLPQTAIEALAPIIQGALKDNAYGEAAKAITRRIVLEGTVQGNKPEEKITRMEAEIAQAPKEIAPLLNTILAHWYWQYFQINRWRFLQRTPTAQPPGNDFTTWDLPRLFAEIDKQFQKALSAAELLKATPVSAFDTLLQKGSFPDAYRPMLYDFIAQEALKFYTSGEQAAARPQDPFEVAASSPIFGSAGQFMAWQPDSSDTNAPAVKAIRLYQDLLRFHQNDTDSSAFISADLDRLVFGNNVAFGEEKKARYQAALKVLVDRWGDHEISALALHHWARSVQQGDDLVRALELAQRGTNAFPKSIGGTLCHNLIREIEANSVSIETERVWNAPWPKIEVRYRNITNLHFRAVAYDWDLFLQKRHNRPENLNDSERKEVLAKAPTLEWSVELPPTDDFKERTETLPAPDRLKPGFYFIVASAAQDFGDKDNQVTFTDIWVSDLALVVRVSGSNIEGFVLEAASGEPVSGADVQAWALSNQGNRNAQLPKKTDENGFFTLGADYQRGYLVRARHRGRELASHRDYHAYRNDRPRPFERTIFFTDRAIYRPGQTIQYKGICLRVQQESDNYDVLGRRELTVVFADPNGQEIARQPQRCNDYGSFTGSFTAPRDRVMGSMRIYVAPGPSGSAHFNVEEYKRPKFQVTLAPPKTAVKLNERATLTGHALSYTGAAVDGAQVKYRVVREVRMPYWWGWSSWRRPQPQGSQEIAHGVTKTDAAGSFQIAFEAKPDLQVAEKDEPTFHFRVHADVTDGSGETRSAQRSVPAGYTALQATLSADDWQTEDKAVELKIKTTTLDGEAQAAEGTLKIYQLQQPAQVHRAPLPGRSVPWQRGVAAPPVDQSDPNTWPLGDAVFEQGFTTDASGVAAMQTKLGVGAYRAMLETQDRFGKKVTARWPIQVLDPNAPTLAIKIPHLLAAPDWSVEPEQEFTALWGTGYDTGRAFIEIEHRNRMIQRYWTKPGQTQQQIKHSVTEAMRGGFTLHVTQVRENRAYLESRRIDVPWSNKNLEIKWEHFTSKLEPNQKETWTAVIRAGVAADVSRRLDIGRDGGEENQPRSHETRLQTERAVAEMVAALYDESLDAFVKQHWPNQFDIFRRDYSNANAAFENITRPFRWMNGQWAPTYLPVELTYRSFPPDLIANAWTRPRMASRPGPRARSESAANGVDRVETLALGTGLALESRAAPEAALAMAGGFGGGAQADKRANASEAIELAAAAHAGPDLSQVTARKNLNETAFFFPRLISDTNGVVKLEFTMPEALTQWRFLGFAHDKKLRSGFLEGHTVTAKDLMVQPNPPRFVREGDTLEFTVKVMNQSAARQSGKVKLTFDELERRAGVSPAPSTTLNSGSTDQLLGNSSPEKSFDIPAKESRSFSWRIQIPDGLGFLTYKAVGSTGRVSDGEEGFLPVLPRRVFVTESLPLSIRGPGTKQFNFASLAKSGASDTLRHQGLTVQMVSNPAWYAVLALPYLMEYPHDCSEQVFNRLYANSLARFIANSDPMIQKVFEQWRNTPALDSPLEKNQDLKALMIEETPWLRQAKSESEARRNVGVLFEANRLNYETGRALQTLAEMQLSDGSWPWFPGGRGNNYITLYIVTGFGRLRHLGTDAKIDPAIRALNRLDSWIDETYRNIVKRGKKEENHLSETIALYFYGRSFFLKDKPIAAPHKEAIDYFLGQARTHWLKLASRQSQGHLSLALKRFNAFNSLNDPTPIDIMKSIKERSVTSEELGRFWRDTELSWWWYRAPIETQALMIEALDEVIGDAQAVEDGQVWLLKQKQTQDWKTTKATADAVYALLLRGRNLLASEALVEVSLGGVPVRPSPSPQPSPLGRGSPLPPRSDKLDATVSPDTGAASPSPRGEGRGEGNRRDNQSKSIEPGTGFVETNFNPAEIQPKLAEITVKKTDQGVAWGGVHWQYFEDMAKLKPYEGTPLKLKKSLFTKSAAMKGLVLDPVRGSLKVGDELVVRIELRVDRDMEYVHLKDQRGSGTEPVNVLSRYRYQDGLAYYESTRDTASHFFIDYLPKGVYVFEYSTRVVHKGAYQTGTAEIQCLYAPEFNSHSESHNLVVN